MLASIAQSVVETILTPSGGAETNNGRVGCAHQVILRPLLAGTAHPTWGRREKAGKHTLSWATTVGLLLFLLPSLLWAQAAVIQHDLSVTLQPQKSHIKVVDHIKLPVGHNGKLEFALHRDLKPKADGIQLTPAKIPNHGIARIYRIELPTGKKELTLRYQGAIRQNLEAYGKERARGFRSTSGLISPKGTYLAGESYWYPSFSSYSSLQFKLSVNLPEKWNAVSQGRRLQHSDKKVIWQSEHPQQEIYLLAAAFHEYRQQAGRIEAQVFLRKPDEALADKYLQATARYLQMYEKLIAPYPYAKFALVENFWETGYGMPSFTLLGPRVIRLPFILTTSYPHEILHNWWGNGVYVDYQSGNWSEGLTAYLADHLFKENSGHGADYRMQSLQKYADYAAKGRDFPLTRFRSRHSSATEAVGYGKTMMLFHMLRLELGDKQFIKALQHFYKNNEFKTAAFDDLRQSFEQIAGRSLKTQFEQWINRTGAPALRVEAATVENKGKQHIVRFKLKQTQPGDAYQLRIPVAVTLADHEQAMETQVVMQEKQQQFEIELSAEPLRLDIDPAFDLFRKLDREEMPPAYTKLFGSKELLVVLPTDDQPEMLQAYKTFAGDIAQMGPDRVEAINDDQLEKLPTDKAVVVLGWQNRFVSRIESQFIRHGVALNTPMMFIDGKATPKIDHAFALITRRGDTQQPLAMIAADRADALPGLGKKLPHYHKYSYLAFEGSEPQNRLKGRWPVRNSPMTVFFQAAAAQAKLKKRKPLATPPAQFSAKRMLKTVSFLAADKLQGRGFGSHGLEQAADYIANAFKQAGLQPSGETADSYFQHFTAKGGDPEQQARLKNIIGIIPARNPKRAKESLIIGAHYDHLGLGWPDVRGANKGKVHFGADDNASGVAVLIELARIMGKSLKSERNVIFIAFSGEEAGRLGSKHYVAKARLPMDKVIGMLNLDTVGQLGDKKLLILGGESASQWSHIFRGVGFVTGIQSVMVKEQLDASDQVSFHHAGVPAVQLFSGANPNYHRPGDSIDKVDAKGMVKVATVAKEVITYLANREEPLSSTLSGKAATKTGRKSSRRVSLGTIPDFAYSGKGYRLQGVTPGSPAATAGLQKGDIITHMGKQRIDSLRQVSKVLKSHQPGDLLNLTFKRKQEVHSVKVILKEK